MEELARLAALFLEPRSLLRLGATCSAALDLPTSPWAWLGRTLELHGSTFRRSAQFVATLRRFSLRWSLLDSLALPKVNFSTDGAKTLRECLPGLRRLDLRRCPRAGGLRLLSAGVPEGVKEVVVPSYLPPSPLPGLKVLSIEHPVSELHTEGQEEWEKLPRNLANLEVLSAPWIEEDELDNVDEDMWDKLHEPPLGCRTTDACLLQLRKMPQLRELDLSQVYTLTDDGLHTLGGLPRLERLVLQNAGRGVTAAGLRSLAESRAPLVFLDLRRCLDTGLRPLSGRTSLTEEDIAAFRRLRPSTEVLFS